jgi:hypothetical protein
MPRYFFDFEDGARSMQDDVGCELNDLEAVRTAALVALAEIGRDAVPDADCRELTLRVRDEDGRYVSRATLSLRHEWIDPEAVHSGLQHRMDETSRLAEGIQLDGGSKRGYLAPRGLLENGVTAESLPIEGDPHRLGSLEP